MGTLLRRQPSSRPNACAVLRGCIWHLSRWVMWWVGLPGHPVRPGLAIPGLAEPIAAAFFGCEQRLIKIKRAADPLSTIRSNQPVAG